MKLDGIVRKLFDQHFEMQKFLLLQQSGVIEQPEVTFLTAE
jgi:hypothetical protein